MALYKLCLREARRGRNYPNYKVTKRLENAVLLLQANLFMFYQKGCNKQAGWVAWWFRCPPAEPEAVSSNPREKSQPV